MFLVILGVAWSRLLFTVDKYNQTCLTFSTIQKNFNLDFEFPKRDGMSFRVQITSEDKLIKSYSSAGGLWRELIASKEGFHKICVNLKTEQKLIQPVSFGYQIFYGFHSLKKFQYKIPDEIVKDDVLTQIYKNLHDIDQQSRIIDESLQNQIFNEQFLTEEDLNEVEAIQFLNWLECGIIVVTTLLQVVGVRKFMKDRKMI